MSNKPRFFALLPVRDEADIIRQCLEAALNWADAVYVYDTGSIDTTYEIVCDMASRDQRICVIGREPVYFNDTRVRGLLFNIARKDMKDGDWFVRLDADEFYHVSPRDFVERNIIYPEGAIYHQYYNFELTSSEVASWLVGGEGISDRDRPIEERRRHYTVSVYAEPRLCRYRSTMRWSAKVSFPYNAGLVARNRIPIRHYPHRDPAQLARRSRLREIMMADPVNRANWTNPELHHWSVPDWKTFVVDAGSADLKFWQPGTDLPTIRQTNHIAAPARRAAQRALYLTGLPRALDHLRDRWSAEDYPLPISSETQDTLTRALSDQACIIKQTQ